jgi:toxin ParE1/3/4
MAAVFQRPAARRDLVEHYVYLAENAGDAVAERFLANVEASFTGLSGHPEMGAPLPLRRPELTGLRKWPVKDFEKFLIFYIPRPHGVSIVRVLHAAQDWWRLLGIDA